MLRNKQYFFFAVVLIVATITLGSMYTPQVLVEMHISSCAEMQDNLQVECVFEMIEEYVRRGDMDGAMHVFSRAYERLYFFASTGCHRYAHRVGDVAYYEHYLATRDLETMEFPQETTACGYGFFHGFLEHLVQDRPSPPFVTEVCEHLHERLGDTMGDVRLICYHGSGHGFTLAQAEEISLQEWGVMRRFVDTPVLQCESLDQATESEVEECKQGVFNVIVDWMEQKQYGFAYNTERPFEPCDELPAGYIHACYYEMAQKLDSVSGRDPVLLAQIARMARTEELARVAFGVGIAGVIQQTIANDQGYEKTLDGCVELDDTFLPMCIESVAHGLFEHGSPQREYEKALEFCAETRVDEHGVEETCYRAVATRLPRFYDEATISAICREFPRDFQASCESLSKSAGSAPRG
ncbi:hypothetical protein COU18_02280 [Candidatus Kaiserbacteria bacterium CG10_big_fil_rev_8_21_14_0_10_51_14]|uniref:Uncharacterized protein n=1 Tax=Candidatus Kaiserbacteria bacterium CG10_big_fil_rev_8_21_14_0_10_51_14 TaxID=1974610 RepID=A0A2H0UBS0_9BACT|nr:MAG: hypothetical protein COU18_02280 [Candidatus Kaiserbacteria bacterium CG10_big_fil_rev_8_21_14_0_10_51_14]